MHRFYLPPESCLGDALRIEGREAHHALHVLRVKRGEPVVVLDGAGHEFFCEIAEASRAAVTMCVRQKNSIPPPACQITLLLAVPKGKIIESIIQKSVELGAYRIVPLLTERVVTQLEEKERANKRKKWQRVAIEAIKQCGAAWLPEIETPKSLDQVLACRNAGHRLGASLKSEHAGKVPGAPRSAPETGSESAPGSSPSALSPQPSAFSLQPSAFDLSLVGSLQTGRRHPRESFQEFQAKHDRLPQSVAVWIGPEGDFTADELKAIQAGGALPISLGRLTLRVETAAIYCLSILNYELNSGHDSKL